MAGTNLLPTVRRPALGRGRARRLHRVLHAEPRSLSSPLASKLLRLIFVLYFSVALITTGAQLMVEYQDEKSGLAAEIRESVALLVPALGSAVWNLDERSLSESLDALSRNGAITGLSLSGDVVQSRGYVPLATSRDVVAGRGRPAASESVFERVFLQSFELVHTDLRGDTKTVGALDVYTTADVVLARARFVFFITVVSALVKTLFLWLILYVVLKVFVATPIEKLAGRLNGINKELERDAIVEDMPHHGDRNDDELRFLLRSFVAMRRALRRSHRQLFRYQHELEAKVEERTDQLRYQASHDDLTGLLNRRAFEQQLETVLESIEPDGCSHSLCFIDLDYFKLVNDTLGHAAGDRVLARIGELIGIHTRPEDIVARIGGDEFALVLVDCVPANAVKVMEKLRQHVEAMVIDQRGQRVTVGMSAGVVELDAVEGELPVAHFMSMADAACYTAKHGGRNQVRVYDARLGVRRRHFDVNWVQLINRALNEDLFELYFQSIVGSAANPHGPVQRIEILLRMLVEEEVFSPAAFMASAERYKLATRIDRWVLSATLEFLASHRDLLDGIDAVHLNLSAPTLANTAFYRHAVREMRRWKIPGEKICFEVTETATLTDIDQAVRIMDGLRRRGVVFALDDFGRGMASHAYLRDLPVDIVKIDGTFVRNLLEDPVSYAIVESVTQISHQMGKTAVAECVEDEATADKLRELGIDFIQGYCYSRPQPLRLLSATGQPVGAADTR